MLEFFKPESAPPPTRTQGHPNKGFNFLALTVEARGCITDFWDRALFNQYVSITYLSIHIMVINNVFTESTGCL